MPAEHLIYGLGKNLHGGLCVYVCIHTHTHTVDVCNVMFTVQLHYKTC